MVLTAPADEVSRRPSPDTWSALEYGCHVRDVFRRFDERLHLMLSETDPQFANWDQDATAVEDDYAGQDPGRRRRGAGRGGHTHRRELRRRDG